MEENNIVYNKFKYVYFLTYIAIIINLIVVLTIKFSGNGNNKYEGFEIIIFYIPFLIVYLIKMLSQNILLINYFENNNNSKTFFFITTINFLVLAICLIAKIRIMFFISLIIDICSVIYIKKNIINKFDMYSLKNNSISKIIIEIFIILFIFTLVIYLEKIPYLLIFIFLNIISMKFLNEKN